MILGAQLPKNPFFAFMEKEPIWYHSFSLWIFDEKRCGQKNIKFCEKFSVWNGVTSFEKGWYMINYPTWTKKEWWSDDSINEGDSLKFCHLYTKKSGRTKKVLFSSNIWHQTLSTNDGRPYCSNAMVFLRQTYLWLDLA